MFLLIQNGEVYAPRRLGRASVLVVNDRIARVGEVDPRALEALGVEHEVVDVRGRLVVPGLIDPHEHLLGGSGESGFSSQTPEIFLPEIVRWGITTVVGALGVDTTMKTMPGLLARAKGLREEGLNAFVWTGGYSVPASSIMGTVRDDLMFIEEVIGAGEVAISDLRALDPTPRELARLATDCYVGGMLAGKAGRVHVHVGDRPTRLQPIRDVLDGFQVEPSTFYLTHVERSEALMCEAIQLARQGTWVDVDTVAEDLPRWLRFFREHDGPWERLTVSSDAGTSSPRVLVEQLRRCVQQGIAPLEELLPLVTTHAARALKLEEKGEIAAGRAADLVVLEPGSLEVVHVLSRGRWMVRDGQMATRPRQMEESSREIHMVGAER